MADGSIGMSGHTFDAFVSSQRTFNDHDLAAKIQEKYWFARQKFLSKIEKNEDSCIVLSDSKLDAKLEIYRSIDRSCARLISLLEDYQNCLYVYANEENSLGILLKECSKLDKTKAGKIQGITGKSLAQSSHQRIRLYMPLLRMYQEMETFHSRAVDDTAETVARLEDRRSKYRASLLWMKDISDKLDPDTYRQLDKFRRVQNQVRGAKKAFDCMQMDVVQKIDLLMASRCNLMNQILAAYQSTLLETFERNYNNFKSIEELIKKEDIYEYEFKALKQLNPLKISDVETVPEAAEATEDLLRDLDGDNNNNIMCEDHKRTQDQSDLLIDVSNDGNGMAGSDEQPIEKQEPQDELDELDQLEALFGSSSKETKPKTEQTDDTSSKMENNLKAPKTDIDLLSMDCDEQIANLLGPSENIAKLTSINNDKGENLLDWASGLNNQFSSQSTGMPTNDASKNVTDDIDLFGSLQTEPMRNKNTESSSIDLLTNELDDIDNSSYFKSLQRLQL